MIQKAALLGTAGITESFFHFGTQTQGLLALGACCCLLSGNESLLSLRFYTITKMLTIIFTGSKKTHQCKKQIDKQLKHNIL